MSREKFEAYMAMYWKLNGRWPDSETVWNAAISEHENQIETLRGEAPLRTMSLLIC